MLRPLHWVDMSSDFDGGIEKILHAVHEITVRPPLGETPCYITTLSDSVGELSKVASTLGISLLNHGDEERGNETSHSGPVLNSVVPMLTEQQINDAVDELEEFGLVRTIKWLGTGPFTFGEVSPTYALFLHFDKQCDYDPEADIKTVAAAVAASSQEQMNGEQLQAICQLSPLRINRAVAYLDDYDYVDVRRFLGNAPFDFGYVRSTRKTRQFVAERCA